jgi:uncharacterized alkaline shock family protein YloU
VADETTVLPAAPHAAAGRTTIADKVLERLAAGAALEVPGVVRHRAGPEVLSAVTSDAPRVSVEVAGERLRIDIKVAVEWEASAQEVAAQLRRHVGEHVGRLTGKTVDRVDVAVTALVPASPETRRRVQ